MSIFLNDVKLEEAIGEKLLRIRIDKYLTWNLQSLDSGKLLYNSLIKPILEYCCTVWGNRSKEQLDRLLRLKKPCARMILDANFQDNSVMLFTKLVWLPIDDIICTRKLNLSSYLSYYVNYVKNGHDYNTRTSRSNDLIMPKCKKNSGLRTFHSSATCLWNKTEPSLRDTLSQKHIFMY